MLVNLKHQGVKVRRHGSHQLQGDEKFTGTLSYRIVGYLDRGPVRHSLGTEEKSVAIRRLGKIERAIAEGPTSSLWPELHDSLPLKTFKFLATRVGYVSHSTKATDKATWTDLVEAFELEMARMIANKQRGASSEEGTMSPSTRERYRRTLAHFSKFLDDPSTHLDAVRPGTIEKFKVSRHKSINALKQARGGSSIALDVAVLHRVFTFAESKGIMAAKPINLKNESKPGKNPKNGARPFTSEELASMGKHAGEGIFIFLLLRWTGLRGNDAVNLKWENVHSTRGVNGEIEVMTRSAPSSPSSRYPRNSEPRLRRHTLNRSLVRTTGCSSTPTPKRLSHLVSVSMPAPLRWEYAQACAGRRHTVFATRLRRTCLRVGKTCTAWQRCSQTPRTLWRSITRSSW
jgi:integrase